MKRFNVLFMYIILSVSVISCSDSDENTASEEHDTLRDRVHEQMRLVKKEMEDISNTTDSIKRRELLAAHQPNMEQLLAMYKQLQVDKSEDGSGGQSALMVDIMASQMRLYESMMKELENQ